jgi:hypothetical protein
MLAGPQLIMRAHTQQDQKSAQRSILLASVLVYTELLATTMFGRHTQQVAACNHCSERRASHQCACWLAGLLGLPRPTTTSAAVVVAKGVTSCVGRTNRTKANTQPLGCLTAAHAN